VRLSLSPMQSLISKQCVAALVQAGFATAVLAQSPPSVPVPCSSPEYRQFDFWLGRWEVFGPQGRKAGDNVIETIERGCALIERWHGQGGYTGTSLNAWDASARVWRQHWVDSQGGVLRLSGRLELGRMVLTGSDPHPDRPAVQRLQRITWSPLEGGAVRQLWEQSDDAGATWAVVFDGRYVKPGP
jgi:hypothetical protein